MTGYGRAQLTNDLGSFVAEIQSLNRKHLEISIALPKELSQFESEARKWISEHVARGQVNVRIYAEYEKGLPVVVKPNLPLARQMKAAWDALAEDLNVSYDASILFSQEDLLIVDLSNLSDKELYQNILREVIQKAIQEWVQMRLEEGKHLQKDLLQRLNTLKDAIQKIAQMAPQVTERYIQKLREQIEKVLPQSSENQERILREIVVFADKTDISEEITRFNSHINQMQKNIEKSVTAIGKATEFLIQEMNREINTIGSKSGDLIISQQVIIVKTELERIREQIQNVE